MIRLIFLLCFLALFSSMAMGGEPWDDDLKPGDKVCLYDIHVSDPLVDRKSDYSLKYWYRLPYGDQKARLQLRPTIKSLLFRVLWPGLSVSGSDKSGLPWYSAKLLAIKGGNELFDDAIKIKLGETSMMVQFGKTVVVDWQVLDFQKVRLKKKLLGRSCERRYEKF